MFFLILDQIFRKTALKIVQGHEGVVQVTEKDLQDYVGKPVFNSDRIYDETPPGVVMGLAWTSLGTFCLWASEKLAIFFCRSENQWLYVLEYLFDTKAIAITLISGKLWCNMSYCSMIMIITVYFISSSSFLSSSPSSLPHLHDHYQH